MQRSTMLGLSVRVRACDLIIIFYHAQEVPKSSLISLLPAPPFDIMPIDSNYVFFINQQNIKEDKIMIKRIVVTSYGLQRPLDKHYSVS